MGTSTQRWTTFKLGDSIQIISQRLDYDDEWKLRHLPAKSGSTHYLDCTPDNQIQMEFITVNEIYHGSI